MRLFIFLLAGLPAFGMAIVLNYVLVEWISVPPALAYAPVLFLQVTINFFVVRRFVFDPSRSDASLLAQYVTFLGGVAVLRGADWLAYVLMLAAGVFFLAAQLINVVVFSVIRFVFVQRVIEGPLVRSERE